MTTWPVPEVEELVNDGHAISFQQRLAKFIFHGVVAEFAAVLKTADQGVITMRGRVGRRPLRKAILTKSGNG